MAVYVNTNVSSLNGRRYLNNVQNQLTTTYQRLSSGMRINSAKDDAAGLQISSRLTTQINGLNQGNRNASDGIALAQTVEGGMDEITGMLQKVRTLAVQASNGTNTAEDRKALQTEANSLMAEISRIAQQTKFGGQKVLDGAGADSIYVADKTNAKMGVMTLQVGANSGDTITFNAHSMKVVDMIATAYGNNKPTKDADGWDEAANGQLGGVTFSSVKATQGVINVMDKLIAHVDSQRADLGAIQNRLESSIRNQANVSANQADARSRIRDADFAEESANLSQQSIIQQAASSMLMQANTRPQLGLSLLG